jgi:hypothetical protein
MLFIAHSEIGHGATDHITFAGFRPAKVAATHRPRLGADRRLRAVDFLPRRDALRVLAIPYQEHPSHHGAGAADACVVSGAATRFMLRKCAVEPLLRARSSRLLIPLVFGMLVIVPPQSYEQIVDSQNLKASVIRVGSSISI